MENAGRRQKLFLKGVQFHSSNILPSSDKRSQIAVVQVATSRKKLHRRLRQLVARTHFRSTHRNEPFRELQRLVEAETEQTELSILPICDRDDKRIEEGNLSQAVS